MADPEGSPASRAAAGSRSRSKAIPSAIERARREQLDRAVEDGYGGCFVGPFTMLRIPNGHEHHDRFFAALQDLDVPVAIHPTYEPPDVHGVRRFDCFSGMLHKDPLDTWNSILFAPDGVKQAFGTFFGFATFDRFPRLKVGMLESAAGWIGAFLDRMDSMCDAGVGLVTGLKQKPSEYFRRQCFISADPDERSAPRIVEQVGAESFVWATDFPHGDHPGNWQETLPHFIEPLSDEARRMVLGDNARRFYRLD